MKSKKFIITIISIVLLNGFVLAIWLYFLSFLKKENNLIKEIQYKIAINDKKKQNSNSLKILINDILDERQKINAVFLDKESIIKFIKNLEFIANETDTSVKINNINIDQDTKNFYLQFTLKGNFNQLFQYLTLLENLPYLINVEKMNLKKMTEEWQLDIEILLIGT